ncbi:MAG TPA: hypothetical protein VFC23_14645 [Thermoanaerobaculia bacterium]|nr:hypothetical protein [Thermoanaerobaculia bacterium]
MRSERFLATAVLLALAAAGSPAWGCSVIAGAAVPTNYEIVREAEAIVLARSIHWQPSAGVERSPWGSIRFEVEEVLKGDFRPSTVTLGGNLEFAGRGPENDFSQARPGTYAGSCQAYDYRLDHHYLFYLRRDGDEEEKAMAGRLFERVREAILALPAGSRSTSPAGRGPV